jgi:DNA-directed RNA polymerase specialized sigma24 family protein
VRRYSNQPQLRRTSKQLAKLLSPDSGGKTRTRPQPGPAPHVRKLGQRLSAETIEALQHAYQAGASLAKLQRDFELGRSSVQRLLREAGVMRRRKSLTDAKVSALVEQYAAGLAIREIAAKQHLPKSTVQDALNGGRRPARTPESAPAGW